MKITQQRIVRASMFAILIIGLSVTSSRLRADTGTCSGATVTLPFTDVMGSPFFCQIAAAFFSGLANGTTATTYSPNAAVTRDQMAAFTTRTLDQSEAREALEDSEKDSIGTQVRTRSRTCF